MICEFCGGQTIKKKVRKVHWLRQQLFIIDDVEAEVCQECGERYYHATTLDAIDRMLAADSLPVKKYLKVQVVGMPASSPA
jgi:YgiT-type zinc finger domain-containing protein